MTHPYRIDGLSWLGDLVVVRCVPHRLGGLVENSIGVVSGCFLPIPIWGAVSMSVQALMDR
jgi:hypothetical protein